MPPQDSDVGRARAMVLEAPRRLVAREMALPEIGDDDGLLRVEACGLCGTDHEQYTGALPGPGPFIPGHEMIGIVEQVGGTAADRWSVRAGDRVAVEVFQSCRRCDQCRAGAYRRCERHGIRDMYGFVPVAAPPMLWGGYATHLYLAPDAMVVPVPPQLDPVIATLFNPLGAGIRWGVTVPGTAPGHNVAVLGPGIRGLCVAAAAKDAGAGFVMVTGAGPRDHPRLELALRFGADVAIDILEEDPIGVFRRETGALADVVVDVTAKAPAAFAQAIDLARSAGTVVVAGTRGSPDPPGFWPDSIVYKELTVVGALGVDVDAYRAALAVLRDDRWPFVDLPREVVAMPELPELLSAMAGESERPPPVHGVVVP